MTPNEKRKLLLELFYQKPGLEFPELFKALDVAEVEVHNEVKALHFANDRLQNQLAALQSRNDELEAYAHTIAHDLKNPLTAIIASCNATRFIGDLTPIELKEFIQQIHSTSYEMNNIIDNLLLLSEVSKVDAPVECVEMAIVVANVQNRLSKMIKEYRGRITSPKTWPAALGYGPWIEEVWANLISNALKYGGRPPRLKLGAATQPDGMIRFWISDNGPGLTQKAKARLFTAFTQLGGVHMSGHGLGLSIVRRIVEKQGGQAGVESEKGYGSLFFFTLPESQLIMEAVSESEDTLFRSDARLVPELV